MRRVRTITSLLLALLPSTAGIADGATVTARDLVGLWEARRDFGPEVRGTLTIAQESGRWTAAIASWRVDAAIDGCWISFSLPGERGSFRGCREADGAIAGHWTQPATRHAGLRAASPVALAPAGAGLWRGEVVPLDDGFTFYLVASEREDGSVAAFLRNPERNFGVIAGVESLEVEGDRVRLVGRWLGDEETTVLVEGVYRDGLDTIALPLRGATYDFRRVDDDPGSPFLARGRDPEPWTYRPPPRLDDGWAVGTLADAGLSVAPIARLVREVVDPPAGSVHAPYLHAVLIARHGKLVLEEYFHGFHRDLPHDTRSASKSLTSFLVGAAIEAGEPMRLDLPVYETVGAPYLRDDLDPRAGRMTLEHLLTMSSGLDCDDRDPESPGAEDRMQSQQENPDWYDYTLRLGMGREPGEQPIYCSIDANLAGRVLAAAAGERLENLIHRLVAGPLDIDRYHLYLQPTGEPYMGGGIHWMPRDFMKLGQVLLDGGVWNGRRVVGEAFAARSIAPLVELRETGYGYLWWSTELPYRDGEVTAFFAGGNGGQIVMGIPELDVLVSFLAGNYSDPVMYRIQEELIPEYILPAVR
jgi:CubicO group peptidase (beta-lactamase class C family)